MKRTVGLFRGLNDMKTSHTPQYSGVTTKEILIENTLTTLYFSRLALRSVTVRFHLLICTQVALLASDNPAAISSLALKLNIIRYAIASSAIWHAPYTMVVKRRTWEQADVSVLVCALPPVVGRGLDVRDPVAFLE